MIGTPSKLSVSVSRKLSDQEYGSFEVAAQLEVNLAPDANLEESFTGLDSWLTASVGKSMADKKAAIQKHQADVAQTAQQPPIVQQVPKPVPATPPPALSAAHGEPQRVPLDEGGDETVVLENPTIAHVILEGGMNAVRVFGGKWVKFGVKCYPEPLEAAKITGWEDWPVCKGNKTGYEGENRYSLPDGFTKVVVAMKGDKPDKVWKFEK